MIRNERILSQLDSRSAVAELGVRAGLAWDSATDSANDFLYENEEEIAIGVGVAGVGVMGALALFGGGGDGEDPSTESGTNTVLDPLDDEDPSSPDVEGSDQDVAKEETAPQDGEPSQDQEVGTEASCNNDQTNAADPNMTAACARYFQSQCPAPPSDPNEPYDPAPYCAQFQQNEFAQKLLEIERQMAEAEDL